MNIEHWTLNIEWWMENNGEKRFKGSRDSEERDEHRTLNVQHRMMNGKQWWKVKG